jgi:hypothetical protein
MRLRLRLTGEALRLTGSPSAWTRPGATPPPRSLLVTENGDPLVTEQGELLLAEPPHDQ